MQDGKVRGHIIMWNMDSLPTPWVQCYCDSVHSMQGMKGHDIMQMLEHNQRLECPDKCPQPIYELMLRCWSWRYIVCSYNKYAISKTEIKLMWINFAKPSYLYIIVAETFGGIHVYFQQ